MAAADIDDAEVRVPLSRRSARARIGAPIAAGVMTGFFAVVGAVASVLLVITLFRRFDWLNFVVTLFVVLLTVGFAVSTVTSVKAARFVPKRSRPATMTITPDCLVLDDPAVFDEPITIDRKELAAIVVDDARMAWPGLHWHRFAVCNDAGDSTRRCLWRQGLPTPVRVVAPGPEPPNVVVLFTAPRRFESMHIEGYAAEAMDAVRADVDAQDLENARRELVGARPLAPHEVCHALFIAVADEAVPAARRAFAPWSVAHDVVRADQVSDLGELPPTPGHLRTAAGVAAHAYVLFAAVLLIGTGDDRLDVLLRLLVVPVAVATTPKWWWAVRALSDPRFRHADRKARRMVFVGLGGGIVLMFATAMMTLTDILDLDDRGPPTTPFRQPTFPTIGPSPTFPPRPTFDPDFDPLRPETTVPHLTFPPIDDPLGP